MITSKRAEQAAKNGFTLIELLVVVGITAMVMMTVSTVFMTFLLSSGRTNAKRIIQSDGNSALTQMEFEVRNARDVSCGSNILTIKNSDGDEFTISKNGAGKLLIGTKVITSQTIVPSSGGPNFTCSGSQVKISFDLNIEDSNNNTLEQSFASTVQVRNLAY